MKTYLEWDRLHPDDYAVMADGDKAVEEVNIKGKESFQGWLRIARSVTRWRELAMQMSGEDDINSYAYRTAMRGAEKHFENLAKLNKAERSQCAWLWDHHVEMETWHRNLSAPEASRYNHPSTIWRKNPLKEYREKKIRAGRAKTADRIETATSRFEEIADRVEVATAVNPGLDLSTPEMIEASAQTLVDYYGARPTVALLRAIAPLVDTTEQSRDPSGVDPPDEQVLQERGEWLEPMAAYWATLAATPRPDPVAAEEIVAIETLDDEAHRQRVLYRRSLSFFHSFLRDHEIVSRQFDTGMYGPDWSFRRWQIAKVGVSARGVARMMKLWIYTLSDEQKAYFAQQKADRPTASTVKKVRRGVRA